MVRKPKERKPKLDKVLTGLGLAAAAAVLLTTSRAGLASGEIRNSDDGGSGIGDLDAGDGVGAKDQTVELDRLDWLIDGKSNSLDFFFAERHRTASNFRFETTLNLRNGQLPTSSGLFD